MIIVCKSIHLSTNKFVSTIFNHSTAELFKSYKYFMGTLETSLLALLFQLVGDIVFLVPRLFNVSVSVKSSFLYDVVKNGKDVHRVFDEFLFFLYARSVHTRSRRCQCSSMINITVHCFLGSVSCNSQRSMFPTSRIFFFSSD